MLAYKAPVCQKTSEAPVIQLCSTDQLLVFFFIQALFAVPEISEYNSTRLNWLLTLWDTLFPTV